MKYDDETINKCIELGVPRIYSDWLYVDHLYTEFCKYHSWKDAPEEISPYLNGIKKDRAIDEYGEVMWDCARLLVEAKKRRKYRILKYLEPIKDKSVISYFVTLDFRSEALELAYNERKKEVTQYLRSQFDHGVANVDYGSQYGREHFHAICWNDCAFEQPDLSRWKLGDHPDCRIVADADDTVDYMLKLVNHSLKINTRKNLIYF